MQRSNQRCFNSVAETTCHQNHSKKDNRRSLVCASRSTGVVGIVHNGLVASCWYIRWVFSDNHLWQCTGGECCQKVDVNVYINVEQKTTEHQQHVNLSPIENIHLCYVSYLHTSGTRLIFPAQNRFLIGRVGSPAVRVALWLESDPKLAGKKYSKLNGNDRK